MEKKITFTFSFVVETRTYNFNETADTEKEALLTLRADLAKVIQEINEIHA